MSMQNEVKPLGQPGGGKSLLVGLIVCGTSALIAVLAVVWAVMHA